MIEKRGSRRFVKIPFFLQKLKRYQPKNKSAIAAVLLLFLFISLFIFSYALADMAETYRSSPFGAPSRFIELQPLRSPTCLRRELCKPSDKSILMGLNIGFNSISNLTPPYSNVSNGIGGAVRTILAFD